jgi:hypothetical protein
MATSSVIPAEAGIPMLQWIPGKNQKISIFLFFPE